MFNDNGGEYVCTGTLLNNVAQDWTPYFLTANHCVDTPGSRSNGGSILVLSDDQL